MIPDFGRIVWLATIGMFVGVPVIVWYVGKFLIHLAMAAWRGW